MAEADRLSDALRYALYPETAAAGMIETEAGWLAEAFYTDEPDTADLRAIVTRTLGAEAGRERRIDCVALADRNWVRESLEAMPPGATSGRTDGASRISGPARMLAKIRS